MKKIIAISQRVDVIESYQETRDSLDQQWTELLVEMNYLPLILPNNPETAKEILEQIKPQGVILTGGSGPVKYGGNSEKRDLTDCYLLHYAIQKNIPLVGFCRGMQSIADFFGYPLQEISGHVATNHPILGDFSRNVNSYHNWGIPKINQQEFYVFAYSEEGHVEGIRHKKYKIMGMMWHPERNNPFEQEDIHLIQKFLK